MGNINGSIEQDVPFNEHFFGLVNFGNTCYVNSVLQALYFCKPFREKIIQYKLAYNQRVAYLSNNKDILNSANNDSSVSSNGENLNGNYSTSNSNDNDYSNVNNLYFNNNNTSNSNGQKSTATNLQSSSNSDSSKQPMLKQEHLLNCLAELFYSIVTMKKKKGIVQPKKFIARLRKDNDAFDNLFQQDAHEFLNYLLNTCADILKEEMKELKELKRLEEINNELNLNNHPNNNSVSSSNFVKLNTKASKALNKLSNGALSSSNKNKEQNNHSNHLETSNSNNNYNNNGNRNNSTNGSSKSLNSTNSKKEDDKSKISNNTNKKEEEELTWIHELFQGILVNETKCLNCETSSSKEENFLDLSVDVEQNTSISHCLQEFSNMEMLCGECKYYCETCSSKQEAEKRMRIKKLPKILALHLKRFKFVGMLNKFKKLTYRVVFPFELRLFNTTEDCTNSDRIYDLVSFVVHCGMGLNRGHYISVVKSHGYWFLFDDEQVEKIEVSNFEEFYGLTQDTNKKSETSYILFYESRES